jgi:TldD protein
MKRLSLILAPVALLFMVNSAQAGDADKVLQSMKTELDRNMAQLSIPDYPRPYFIAYLMREAEAYSVGARFGAPVVKREDRQRVIYIDMRVGDPDLDNTMDRYPGFDMPFVYNPYANRAPLADDDKALRTVLWKLTDKEYKKAVASYLKVKAQRVYKRKDPDFAGCFAPAPKVEHVGESEEFIDDFQKYQDITVALSRQLSEVDFIHDSSANFDASRSHRFFVNSEGTQVHTSDLFLSFNVQAQARSEDGSVVPHSFVLYARKIKDLPSQKELEKRVAQLVTELDALRQAEVMQPFNGPALLEGDTAGVFLHEALGHRLEGHRQSGGDEGGTFSGKVGDQILPEFISIVDDPTMPRFGGTTINGYYQYDDEGVAAQKVTLVDKGKLSGFLLTRRPLEMFKKSNGHARSSGPQRPVARMGTLIMSSDKTVPFKDLKKELVRLAKKQGKKFGIILRNAASGATNTSSWGFQAFKGVARLVYQVDVKTGKEKLVRGVELVGTPLASLMKIVTVGDDAALFNGFCGAESGFVPVSTLTPSLILSELELQKSPPRREQKEVIPPPQ